MKTEFPTERFLYITSVIGTLHRCPNTKQIIYSADKTDDKVLCSCGRTQPRLRELGHEEAVIPNGKVAHVKRWLHSLTYEEARQELFGEI